MVFDFHTHTFLSDGALLPMESIRRAVVNGYQAIGLTDHAAPSNMERVINELRRECRLVGQYWPIQAIPGVELTHVPAGAIPELAAEARRLGARLVVVHGETLVEPVEPGTNQAAAGCRDVDILAHPGLLTPETARLAAQNGVFIEVTARGGHNVSNGHVVQVGRAAGVQFLVDSDAHEPEDLLTADWARLVARGAGLDEAEAAAALQRNPLRLLERIAAGRNVPGC